MAYSLEIAIVKTLGNKPRLSTYSVGESTRLHWEPLLDRLNLDADAMGGDDWIKIDSITFALFDPDVLSFDGLPEHDIQTLKEIKAKANDDRATVTLFAQLV